MLSERYDIAAAQRPFRRAISTNSVPFEGDRAAIADWVTDALVKAHGMAMSPCKWSVASATGHMPIFIMIWQQHPALDRADGDTGSHPNQRLGVLTIRGKALLG